MATYTPNYGLHQWVAEDDFLRTDFNEDFNKIESALTGLEADKVEIVTGKYQGNEQATRTIKLGFRAKVVLVVSYSGLNTDSLDHMLVQLAFDGVPAEQVEITDNGFTLQYRMNDTSWGDYHYLAIP